MRISVFCGVGRSVWARVRTRTAFTSAIRIFLQSTLLGTAFSSSAFSFPITYSFTGHLTYVDEVFSGWFTIESTTPRSPVPDWATWAMYCSKSAPLLTIGNRTWSRSDQIGRCRFTIQNGDPDDIDFACSADQGRTDVGFWWRFSNKDGSAFVDKEIPVGPFAPSAFYSQQGALA